MKVAVVGAGWAGMAAAVRLTELGCAVTVFEATKTLGGRARLLAATLPDGSQVTLDNGQHILIGAYSETLKLMQRVGIDVKKTLLRLPLALQFPGGDGLKLPAWPAPFNALAGIALARGWTWTDKASLIQSAVGWRLRSFDCDERASVTTVCAGLKPRVMQELIEPLCVAALNTPADRASGRVFLRVLRDSLFGEFGSSDLLLPKTDLTTLFPQAAWNWIAQRGGVLKLGRRVDQLEAASAGWRVGGPQLETQVFDRVILATSASGALSLLEHTMQAAAWVWTTQALHFEAIATVYAWGEGVALAQPMLALRSETASPSPAQFVFDRGQLGGPAGLLAFVVSASIGEREALQAQVLAQARRQLGMDLQAVQTVVEKRATFACTPALARPPAPIAPGLLACGDYLQGPYPATLEGAVRSGLAAACASP